MKDTKPLMPLYNKRNSNVNKIQFMILEDEKKYSYTMM